MSISGYGQTGEWRGAGAPTRRSCTARPGYLHTAAQLTSAAVEHDPMSIADLAAAKDATIALLAALMQRGRTGRGQHIDISLAHSILYLNEFAAEPAERRQAAEVGLDRPGALHDVRRRSFSAGNPISSEVVRHPVPLRSACPS